jgi:hypothetical protein
MKPPALVACTLAVTLACAHPVSRPRTVPPAPVGQADYLGRIVLRTPALVEHVGDFARAWSRRVSILGLRAQFVFDADRAVVDLSGTGPALVDVARVLADPGRWSAMRSSGVTTPLDEGELTHWKLPTPECHCATLLRTHYREGDLARLDGAAPLTLVHGDAVDGRVLPHLWVEWRVDEQGQRHPIAVEFYLEESGDAARDVALALAGGSLPATPEVVSVQAGGAR